MSHPNVLYASRLLNRVNATVLLNLYVEPAATAMNRFISRVGFKQESELGKKKPMFHLHYDRAEDVVTTRDALIKRRTHEVIERIDEYRGWWREFWPNAE